MKLSMPVYCWNCSLTRSDDAVAFCTDATPGSPNSRFLSASTDSPAAGRAWM